MQLRAHILELLTRGLAPRPDAGDSVYRLLLQLCMPATAKLRTESRRLACGPGKVGVRFTSGQQALCATHRMCRQRSLVHDVSSPLHNLLKHTP